MEEHSLSWASDPAGFREKPSTRNRSELGHRWNGARAECCQGVSIPRGWPLGVEGLTTLPRGSQQEGGTCTFLSSPPRGSHGYWASGIIQPRRGQGWL